jgi:pentose-5-phosphate-3-epimerase
VLAVDGGITKANIAHVASLGVDLIVTGSAVYDGIAPADNARAMLEATWRARQGDRRLHRPVRRSRPGPIKEE